MSVIQCVFILPDLKIMLLKKVEGSRSLRSNAGGSSFGSSDTPNMSGDPVSELGVSMSSKIGIEDSAMFTGMGFSGGAVFISSSPEASSKKFTVCISIVSYGLVRHNNHMCSFHMGLP